ncbi:11743_t:CDS:2, partial [Entrophospora sp. SA101]
MENEFYQDLAETYINEESNTNCESDNGNVINVINDNGNSIQWLADTLPYEANNDSKKDARCLKQCLLQDYEWDLLEKVLLLLKPFEEATTFFSGAQYPTSSLMYPTIQKLKIKYACGVTGRNRKDDNDNDESQKKSNPPPRPNLNNIAMIFQQKIYESLFDYWNQTSDIGLLATLLDPRLKKMVLFDYETRTRTIEKLNELYLELKYVEEQDRQSSCISSSSQATKVSPFFESIFGNLNDEESELSE